MVGLEHAQHLVCAVPGVAGVHDVEPMAARFGKLPRQALLVVDAVAEGVGAAEEHHGRAIGILGRHAVAQAVDRVGRVVDGRAVDPLDRAHPQAGGVDRA